MNDIKMKILVIGESGVGKSSLMLRFAEGKFDDNEVNMKLVFYVSNTIKTIVKIIKMLNYSMFSIPANYNW